MNIEQRASELLSLRGKVAMVTGAASGIGRGIAVLLAEMGASVVVLDIDEQPGADTAATIVKNGGRAHFVRADVRVRADCRAAADRAIAEFGHIDILCNNAGVIIRKDVVDLAEEEWDTALDITLKGIHLLSHEVIPHMIRHGGGSVINTGSGWSLRGGPKAAAYCAAKGGVVNLTRAMAIDHGRHNIRVNFVREIFQPPC
jgi:NAD(P)-dependent dehydrogenase (short-subunit alcohol dehydrogenase family)